MGMPFNLKRSALLCSLALAVPGFALAEETLTVTAQPAETADSPTSGYTVKTSKGATKTDQPLITTGQSVSVITRQQMEDQGAMNLNQALNYTPGAFTNFAGGASRFDTISLRGFHGTDVNNTFLDGLRVMSDSNSHNILQIDPWFIERVDIIKGPSSATYGQTIPGGLVNMTSKLPQFNQEGHFRLSTGTQETNGAAFDYTNAINSQWAWRLTGMTRKSDTQYDHAREERYAISPSVLWQPDSDTSLLLKAYLQKDPSGGFHGSVPADGSLYEHNGYKLSPGFNDGAGSPNQYKRREQIYSYAFSHRFNDTWAFRSNASYSHSNVEIDQLYQSGWIGNTNTLAQSLSSSRSSLDAFAIDNQLQADFTTGALAHTLLMGVEYHRYKNDISELPYPGIIGSVDAKNYTTTLDAFDRNYNDVIHRYYQTGAYLQDEMVWDKWHLNLSGRYDRIVTNASDTDRRQDDYISARSSLLYAFDNGLSPYISWSQGITPTAFSGLNTRQLLKPSTSEQYEAGLKYQPPGTSDLYSIAAYDLTQNDVANRNVNLGYYEPAGKVHSQGFELEARNQLTPRLSTIAGYTLNHVRYKETVDGNDGHTPYITPNQMASLWGHYQFDYGISAGAGVRYIGKQWADNENTRRMPSVTLFDASVKADLGVWNNQLKGAWVQVNANNLTDRTYVAACYGTGNCYWGAERTITATVGYDF
ncbi:iron complex outermembrane receptor protein [Pantoea alhagi]|uniref:TonB-dependent siderophore receptor n=1 Tax=Mixta sp. BE291 TaxID=3158787 RepID=UPI002866CC70|nr:iron complex outermembrane receptor protein [Pantoea alhagi]